MTLRVIFSYLFFACSLTVAVLFGNWLLKESADEKVHTIAKEYDKLYLGGKPQAAKELLSENLAATGDGPLNPIWLVLIQKHRAGYDQLAYYLRVLESDPEREATYAAISRLIALAPASFQREIKPRYLRAINDIPGINREHLEQFELTLPGET